MCLGFFGGRGPFLADHAVHLARFLGFHLRRCALCAGPQNKVHRFWPACKRFLASWGRPATVVTLPIKEALRRRGFTSNLPRVCIKRARRHTGEQNNGRNLTTCSSQTDTQTWKQPRGATALPLHLDQTRLHRAGAET